MIALAAASEEASWRRSLLSEIPTWERSIHRKHSTIRELLTTGAVIVDYVQSDDNLVDPLTKGLAREKVFKTSERMGLKPIKT
ncbi:Retrovirus-related Pol polyprotein from transposon TNT 1-94 [Cucumis melo var. makuwa]|uniref:Retrovirus-related Pol polyprotein from transposon TNT 1-94 n=1 Tax=Cucumis melo var. makuwa TaxID=1194695 RepID=A0A5D3DD58_CUCMM|nr:Retrovirus-related Pol polyprotein from transposon TNT 1-94 [Cucumis melo var. makuwa]TYK21199.1 Retrovirus-related Pol polyprotein from transposon TNT 1-94 [Cucumis melo var. makuwa]